MGRERSCRTLSENFLLSMSDTISTVRLLFMQQDTLQKKRGSTDFHLSHEGRAPEAVPPMRLLDRSNLQRTIRGLGRISSNIERIYQRPQCSQLSGENW